MQKSPVSTVTRFRQTADRLVASRLVAKRCVCAVFAISLSFSAPADGSEDAAKSQQLRVTYALSQTVYLDGGRSEGLAVGQRLLIRRDGETVAELEVQFVAAHSAACRIIEELGPIDAGDLVVSAAGKSAGAAAMPPAARGRSAPRPNAVPEKPGASPPARPEPSPVTAVPPTPSTTRREPASGISLDRAWADLSGTISMYWQHFEDGSPAARNFDQTTLRLNLRMREIQGSNYDVNVRVRGRENRRAQASGPAVSERQDRLYELSLTYDPPDGKLYYQLGRLRSGPQVGFDYLDGVLAEYRFKPRFGVGGFFGTRSDIEALDLESTGQTYGAFFHYRRNRSRESPFYADLRIGAVGEYDSGEVSREYLSLYARLGSGSRWTLYQRADVDLNRDWRKDTSGDSYQVSNLLLSGTYRFSRALRFGLSYDQRRRYRDLENRDTPEERFDDQLRDGWRATVYMGRPRGWRVTTSFGLRRQELVAEDSTTVNASVYHSDLGGWKLLLGLDYSAFSGATSDGQRLGLRLRKYLRGGHDIGLTLGTSENSSTITGLTREDQWVRLSGTARLPKGFFVLWEVELAEGDDLDGQRSILQLGYRL